MAFEALTAALIRLACGARPLPADALPSAPVIFFANHSSHLDFAAIWAALPDGLRRATRPVAGRDYWEATSFRRWLARDVFRAVLIERRNVTVSSNPLEPMVAALDAGASLIVFPEGTRSTDGTLQEFKSGIYHLARARPTVPLVPVLLENLNRVLPKGDFLPVPVIASVVAGPAITLADGEPKPAFLQRARDGLAALQRT